MKHNLKYLSILLFACFAAVSCDSFLDRQEDERLSFEKIWEQRSRTQQYFFNVMGYLPNDAISDIPGQSTTSYNTAHGASDEGDCQWNRTTYTILNNGSWNASSLPNSNYNHYYAGIRDCNIFLQNVMSCSDAAATQTELTLWYNCARWARAYYYFLLMRDFGPVFLLGDEIIDVNASLNELERPRNTWEECVNYVVSEMEWCSTRLPQSHTSSYMGLPTSGAAKAVISRLLLYSARDLFNGNTLYRGVRNPNGTQLFPQTYDAQKWVRAAQAAKAVIDEGVYSLYRDESDDPCLNYYGVFQQHWNSELIYCGGGYTSRWSIGVHTNPALQISGTAYGAWGPTQQQVDAYAMANGRYPITGYDSKGYPVIDEQSTYSSNEFAKATFQNPFLQALGASQTYFQGSWPVMYRDREPRFYVTVFWGDSYWMHGTSGFHKVSFCRGTYATSGNDWPNTGYLVNKWYDHTLDSYGAGQWGNITYPTFRLGEIYLNYIEAVLECEKYGATGENVDRSLAMQYWAELRDRSGMGAITEAYPGASIDELIELVRKERRIELAFEGHRHYDTRTWMIATTTDNGPMYGMNIQVRSSTDATADEYWQRKAYSNRVFKNNHYLFPFMQRDLDRNSQLTQNYGW